MKIDIITHCWRYSRVLNYQLSSLLLHPPENAEVVVWVCYCPDDTATDETVRYFRENYRTGCGIAVGKWKMDRENLLNRAIGRNQLALHNFADVVWFTDCDYCFGDGCLDALAAMDLPKERITFPTSCWITTTHDVGEGYADRLTSPKVCDVHPADFTVEYIPRPIGGVQIVSGDLARRFGYCPDHKGHQAPLQGDQFPHTKCDVHYRKDIKKKLGLATDESVNHAIDLPNLYRIRERHGQVDVRHKGDQPIPQGGRSSAE